MVCFLVIIFDGANEDVPNEDLTLIKDELSLSLFLNLFLSFAQSLPLINDKTIWGCCHGNSRCKVKREFVKRSNDINNRQNHENKIILS